MAKLNARRHASTEEAQASYLAKVDELVETSRAMPAAKADAYRAKYDDACGIMAGSQSLGWVAAEAAALGKGELEVAKGVIAAHEEHHAKQSALEAARVAAKDAIRSASSPVEMLRITESLKAKL